MAKELTVKNTQKAWDDLRDTIERLYDQLDEGNCANTATEDSVIKMLNKLSIIKRIINL